MLPPLGDYVIFSMQRSASTTLCTWLNGYNGTDCQYELLNFGVQQSGYKWSHLLNISVDHIHKHPEVFVNLVRSKMSTNITSFGFKVFPQHINWSLLPALIRDNRTCIILSRANITAQYISWKRAHTSGCWATSGTQCHNISISFDNTEFEHYKANRDQWYAYIKQVCAHKRVVEESSENFIANLN